MSREPHVSYKITRTEENITIVEKENEFLLNFQERVQDFFKSGHTNNWAVLVDTSRFWFNYRHVANVLSIYRSVKRLGIPDRYVNMLCC